MKKLVILFVFSIFIFPSLTSAATFGISSPSNNIGLVGWWTMDGKDTPWTSATAATTLDKSGNGNTGTLTNMAQATSPVAGKVGQGLKFDGSNDYVSVASSTSLFGLNKTISLWVNPTVISSNNAFLGFKDTMYIRFGSTAGTVLNLTYITPASPTGRTFTPNFPTVFVGKWTNFVFTYSNDGTTNTINVYINGAFASATSTTEQIIPSPLTSIGRRSNNSLWFSGTIDDFRYYNRALSATEITQLYNQGAATKQAASPNVTATSSCSTGLSCGLVGYWTFDGHDMTNGRVNDVSGNGNNGNLINIATSTFYVPGKIGQGFRFDGSNDYVTAGKTNIPTTGAVSISTWVKIEPSPSGTDTVLANWSSSVDSPNRGYFKLILTNGNTPVFYGLGRGSESGGLNGMVVATSPTTLTPGIWYHIVGTAGGLGSEVNTKIYVNGVLKALGIGGVSYNAPSTNFRFGINTYDTTLPFPGSLDDVRIYNRALSTTEITQLYNIGAATKQAASPNVTATTSCSTGLSCGLVGYWTFDGKDTPWTSATAATTLDKSGNGNTGTLTNMTQATSPVAGKVGQGLKFDGVNDYVNAGSASSLDNLAQMSISLWVYMKVNSGDLISKDRNNPYGWRIKSGGTNTLTFSVQYSSTALSRTSSSAFLTDKWTHVVVTWNGANSTDPTGIKIYKNGQEVSAGSVTGGVGTRVDDSTLDVLIGVRGPALGTPFYSNSIQDDVRIYNRALSANEVQQLYNIGR